MFKVGAKIAKTKKENFFWPTEKQKTLGPKSSAMWDLWRHLTFKIDLHPPGTPNPPKNQFCWSKNAFLEGFGVPGGCKSILNVSINPIWRNFLDRGFFVFRWVKKKVW